MSPAADRTSDENTLNHSPQSSSPKEKDDGGEQADGHGQDMRPVGFWHPELNATRKLVVKKWAITSMYARLPPPTRGPPSRAIVC